MTPGGPKRGIHPAGAFEPRAIIEVLDKHEVELVIIGGVASALHGSPFVTVDLDVVPALETSNLDRLAEALKELEAVLRDAETPEGIEIELSGRILKKALPEFGFLHFDTKHGYLDLIYEPAGTRGFRDLARAAIRFDVGAAQVRVAALEDVIRSKQAAARPRDLEQLPTLRRLLELQMTEE